MERWRSRACETGEKIPQRKNRWKLMQLLSFLRLCAFFVRANNLNQLKLTRKKKSRKSRWMSWKIKLNSCCLCLSAFFPLFVCHMLTSQSDESFFFSLSFFGLFLLVRQQQMRLCRRKCYIWWQKKHIWTIASWMSLFRNDSFCYIFRLWAELEKSQRW